MLTTLTLANFKGFRQVTIPLGPFSVLIGTNASGKSNVRDARRFLHGISRGYALPEIIGEKYAEGGVLQWRGIRGGRREIARAGSRSFSIGVTLSNELQYRITIDVGSNGKPRVMKESLYARDQMVFGGLLVDAVPRLVTGRDASPIPSGPGHSR